MTMIFGSLVVSLSLNKELQCGEKKPSISVERPKENTDSTPPTGKSPFALKGKRDVSE